MLIFIMLRLPLLLFPASCLLLEQSQRTGEETVSNRVIKGESQLAITGLPRNNETVFRGEPGITRIYTRNHSSGLKAASE